jgi:hypothetical protein
MSRKQMLPEYGLELEHILSPDKINFYEETLIEEHIMVFRGCFYKNAS